MDARQKRIYAVVGLVLILLVSAVGTLMWFGWIPFPDFLLEPIIALPALGIVILAVIGYFIVRNLDSGGYPDYFGRKTARQLTDTEAFELLRYRLFFKHNMRIGDIVSRGPEMPTSNSGGEDADTVRLYRLVFDRVNIPERVGVYMDLEQEMSIDLDKLHQHVDEIENIRIIRGSKIHGDFQAEMEEARKQMSQSLMQTITEIEYEDGEPARKREMPAIMRNSSKSSRTEESR